MPVSDSCYDVEFRSQKFSDFFYFGQIKVYRKFRNSAELAFKWESEIQASLCTYYILPRYIKHLKKHKIIQKILECVETTVIVVLGNENVRGHDISCCQIYTTSKMFRDNVSFDFLKLYFLKVE